MTDKEKLKEIKKLADAMYYTAFNLTTDASLLRKAMKEYHQFIIHEYHKEEPVSVWHDASKETPTQGSNILMVRKEEKDTNYPPIAGCFHGTNLRLDGRNWGYYNGFCYNEIEPPIKWAYVDELLKLDNPCNISKNLQEELVSEELELTWEDIPKILHICEQLKTRWWFRDDEQTKQIGRQPFWEEVLRIFKTMKDGKED